MIHVLVGMGVPPDDADSRLMDAVCETPLNVAVAIAVWLLVTLPAIAVKGALVEPDGTVTVGETVSVEELLERFIVTPPEPAAWDKVAVHVDAAPELRLDGVQDNEISAAVPEVATKAIEAVWFPFNAPVITADWLVVMFPAVAVKTALMAPDATKTDVGTVSAGKLLDSVTVAPPEPAAWDKVAVHVEIAPELRLAGAHDNELSTTEELEPEMVASNSSGGNPFTSAMTLVTVPDDPAPRVRVSEACP